MAVVEDKLSQHRNPILAALAQGEGPATPAEIARRAKLPPFLVGKVLTSMTSERPAPIKQVRAPGRGSIGYELAIPVEELGLDTEVEEVKETAKEALKPAAAPAERKPRARSTAQPRSVTKVSTADTDRNEQISLEVLRVLDSARPRPRSLEQIAIDVGVDEQALEPIMGSLEAKGLIKRKELLQESVFQLVGEVELPAPAPAPAAPAPEAEAKPEPAKRRREAEPKKAEKPAAEAKAAASEEDLFNGETRALLQKLIHQLSKAPSKPSADATAANTARALADHVEELEKEVQWWRTIGKDLCNMLLSHPSLGADKE